MAFGIIQLSNQDANFNATVDSYLVFLELVVVALISFEIGYAQHEREEDRHQGDITIVYN